MDGRNIDIMNELVSILLQFIRKQAGMVIILMTCCAGLIWLMLEQKRELTGHLAGQKAEYLQEIAIISGRLDNCLEANGRLIVEVEVLKVEMSILKRGIRK